MNDDYVNGHQTLVSLPRPQRQLPLLGEGRKRFSSIEALVKAQFEDRAAPPTHAWVRYSLSAGTPLDAFAATYASLADIRHAFGRQAFVIPISLSHHEVELCELDHMVNPESGQHEIEVNWRKKRCDGGSHFLFGVSSDAEEGRRDSSEGLDALDALESLMRVTLGAMVVIETRNTLHVDLIAHQSQSIDEGGRFRIYGPEEHPRTDAGSLLAAIDLAEGSSSSPPPTMRRISLGLRWANVAFKSNDLLSFWTAIEVLANCRGHRIYGVVAAAYGRPKEQGQVVAKELGLDRLAKLRGELAHLGIPVHIDPQGASFLSALAHDLARYAAGLPPLGVARAILGQGNVDDWFRPDIRS